MQVNIQSWYRILDYWCNRKTPLGSGLTIPYLIGIIYQIDCELITTNDFLELILTKEDKIFSIRKCDVIGEYVLQLNDENDLASLSYYTKFKNIYLTEQNLITKENKFEKHLDKKYTGLISRKTFSKNDGNWNKFNDDEIKWIKNVLQQ